MDRLQGLVQTLLDGFLAIVDLLEPVVRSVLGALLNTEIQQGGARLVTALILIGALWFPVSKWLFTVPASAKPQKITLFTEKTPMEVVVDDLMKSVTNLILLAVILGLLVVVARSLL